MKILVLCDDFPPHHAGGAGTVAFSFAQEMQRHGHTVHIITTVRTKGDAGVGEIAGMHIHRIWSIYDLRFQAYVSMYNPRVVRQVHTLISEYKPDIVHAHNVHAYLSYASLMVAKRSGARVILTAHDVMSFNYGKLVEYINPNTLSIPTSFNYRTHWMYQLKTQRFRYNPFRNYIIRYILRTYVDRIVAVSSALKQALQDNGIKHVDVIYNGIDIKKWEVAPAVVQTFQNAHGIGSSAILFGGRLAGVKGTKQILDALVLITREVPTVQLVVFGNTETTTARMTVYAREVGVLKHVIFVGWIVGEDLHTLYHACAVVVVPSLSFDSFPTVNLEAFACKKPVVATCFGGSSEIVREGINGYVVNPFDVSHMAKKITDLLSNPSMAGAYGNAGYAMIERQCTLDMQTCSYEVLFEELRGM